MKQIHLDEEARGRPVANNLNCGVAGLWNADAVRRLYFGGGFVKIGTIESTHQSDLVFIILLFFSHRWWR